MLLYDIFLKISNKFLYLYAITSAPNNFINNSKPGSNHSHFQRLYLEIYDIDGTIAMQGVSEFNSCETASVESI